MFIKFLHLPLAKKIALLTAVLCFCACGILILVSYQGNQQLISRSTELFGESLAQQLSRDASNPLVTGDKLSLQSLLKKLVESPMVISGAIYDVDNRPIAEAGGTGSGLSFSASITFQDSIAGYAVITFDTHSQQQQASLLSWQLAALALLLAGLIYCLSLIPARQLSATLNDLSQIARTPKQHRRANIQVAYRGEDELRQLARDISNPMLLQNTIPSTDRDSHPNKSPSDSHLSTLLLVEVINLTELQQPSSTPTIELMSAFQRQLTSICKLYDGTLNISRSNSFNAQFYFTDDEENSYPFRALCCAYLIRKWVESQKQLLPLSIRIGLALHDSKQYDDIETELAKQQTIEQLFHLTQHVENGLFASTELYQHSSVQHRIKARAIDHRLVLVEQLVEPYQALLDKQLTRLQNQHL